jgi:hypothetical protein
MRNAVGQAPWSFQLVFRTILRRVPEHIPGMLNIYQAVQIARLVEEQVEAQAD